MNRKLLFVVVIFFIFGCKTKNNKMTFIYPETQKVDTIDDYFGTKVADPYRWLEDDNSEQTKAWVIAQNKVTFDYFKAIPFRQQLIDRLTKIYNYEKYSAPFEKGGKYFYYKNNGLQNQSVLYVQSDLKSEAKMLLDPNTLSTDGTVALSVTAVSKDGKYLAYAISRAGSDWNEIYVIDIESGKTLNDHIEWAKFTEISWFKDGFFYSRFDTPAKGTELTVKNENQKVYYHKIGTAQADDELVYQNPENPTYGYGTATTDDEKYLFLNEWESSSGNGLYFKDLTNPKSEFIQIAKGFDNDFALIDNIDNNFLIYTNLNAPKYKLIQVDAKSPSQKFWVDIIPENKNVLQAVTLGGGKILATYMEDAKSKVEICDLKGNFVADFELPGIGTVGGFSTNKDDKIAFYSFYSFTTPPTIYKYDFETNKSEIFRMPAIDFNFDNYTTEQVFYTSKDGTKIPMFIVHKKDIKLDGSNPTLLYAYGGFNVSLTPSFSVSRLLWLENGGVYALANIRGGGEYGEDWHKAGTLLNKQNVFDDFIAAGEYLISQKYTSNQKLAIQGGSNGGLLIGAVTNQRPDLFKVAIPQVGVMDMLRYHLFTVGRAWASDYGLSEDKTMFEYLYKYSPVHNIKENVEYPSVLVTTGDHDDRVVPAHSFKYIATLQQKYKGENPVMIRIETNAGHGAGKPTEKIIEEAADIYAFIMYNMGISPQKLN